MKNLIVPVSLPQSGAKPGRVLGVAAVLWALAGSNFYGLAQERPEAQKRPEDRARRESPAAPLPTIGWANVQWPPSINHTLGVTNLTESIYGQVWIDGVTSQPGAATNLIAELGFQAEGESGDTNWTWVAGTFNVDVGNNDEFKAALLPEAEGSYAYIYRYSISGGKDWFYADLNGPVAKGQSPSKPGKLLVKSIGDTNAPAVPAGVSAKPGLPTGVALSWSEITGDSTFYGYEVLRSGKAGGPYQPIARVTKNIYDDAAVQPGSTNYYVVRSVDQSFNRSANSREVSAVVEARKVSVTLQVTVPDATGAKDRPVHIAGNLDVLGEGFKEWDPGEMKLKPVSATQWTITFTGKEGTRLTYKYALGAWDYVEKNEDCEEVDNRELTITYGTIGHQVVKDTVLKWRNVAPCED